MNSINQVNKSMFAAAEHLVEASKYLSDTGFKEEGVKIMVLADTLLSTMVIEPPKMTETKMQSIMDEIINYGS